MLLLLLSRFSRVRLCATPSLGFSRQEHWSGLPFPSPMQERKKWKWSHSVMSDSSRPRGLQLTRLLHPWDFPGKSTGVGCHCLLCLGSLYKCDYFLLDSCWLCRGGKNSFPVTPWALGWEPCKRQIKKRKTSKFINIYISCILRSYSGRNEELNAMA